MTQMTLMCSCPLSYGGRLGPFHCQFVNFQRATFPNSHFSKQQLFQTVTFTNMNFLYPTLCSISTNAGSGEPATNRNPRCETKYLFAVEPGACSPKSYPQPHNHPPTGVKGYVMFYNWYNCSTPMPLCIITPHHTSRMHSEGSSDCSWHESESYVVFQPKCISLTWRGGGGFRP